MLAPVPVAKAAPSRVTVHARVNPVVVSTVLGSVIVLPRVIAVPTRPLAGAPVIWATGATLPTWIATEVEPTRPELVTVRVTTYSPLSLGLRLRLALPAFVPLFDV